MAARKLLLSSLIPQTMDVSSQRAGLFRPTKVMEVPEDRDEKRKKKRKKKAVSNMVRKVIIL